MPETSPAPPSPFVRRLAIDLATTGAIGFVLAIIGPLGTISASFSMRAFYWLALCLAGYGCFRPIAGFASLLAPRIGLPIWSMLIVATLIASIPMTLVVSLFTASGLRHVRFEALLVNYGYVVVIGGAVTALFHMMRLRAPAPAPTTSDPSLGSAKSPEPSEPQLLERLPYALGRAIVALEMEDHYVRVHTLAGSHLLLMRMRDAVAELDGIDGAQVHRSWWVARAMVERVERDGRSYRMFLRNGIAAPVARSSASALRQAGWLNRTNDGVR